MADITIQDLLAWEPRLQLVRRPIPGMTAASNPEEREISWAVTIRASTPMLQPLRGGELVLLPERALAGLEEALSQRSHWLTLLELDPRFDALRDDPRLKAISDRVIPQ